ncbi:MAG: DNA repair protein RecO [Bacilli bacterium]|jgi:DNA repair protein RecO (recombination protein O)|nr:DNA repair protein RecO [Bacilli bacterium]
MQKEIEGIIIKEIPYGETSKIIHVYTKDGVVGIMCKGAKTLKSPFRATTLKFTYGRFNIYYKENKLSTLTSVDIINPLSTLKNDIILLSYLNYLTELTEQVIKQSTENIYEDFITTILKINDGLDPIIMCNILEIKFLDYLGVGLNLDACIGCGSTTNIITIDGDRGGYICQKCFQDEIIVEPKTIELLRMYYYVEIKSISKLKISEKIKDEINRFLDTYYDRYTGLYLKSKNFLKKLI